MDWSKVSFDAQWGKSATVLEEEKKQAIAYAVVFGFTSTMLLISIIRTITTNPGNIPDHKEWDMSTDTSAGEEASTSVSRPQPSSSPQQDQGAGAGE